MSNRVVYISLILFILQALFHFF